MPPQYFSVVSSSRRPRSTCIYSVVEKNNLLHSLRRNKTECSPNYEQIFCKVDIYKCVFLTNTAALRLRPRKKSDSKSSPSSQAKSYGSVRFAHDISCCCCRRYRCCCCDAQNWRYFSVKECGIVGVVAEAINKPHMQHRKAQQMHYWTTFVDCETKSHPSSSSSIYSLSSQFECRWKKNLSSEKWARSSPLFLRQAHHQHCLFNNFLLLLLHLENGNKKCNYTGSISSSIPTTNQATLIRTQNYPTVNCSSVLLISFFCMAACSAQTKDRFTSSRGCLFH